MTKPNFRQALESDLPAICELGRTVNALHHDKYPNIFAPPSSTEEMLEHWRRDLFGAGAIAFVAEADNSVIAFINATLIDETNPLLQPIRCVRVGSIGVSKPYRKQGIGRNLVEMIEQWAVEEGASDIRLNVWTFNQSARRLYDELGYEIRSLNMGKPLIR